MTLVDRVRVVFIPYSQSNFDKKNSSCDRAPRHALDETTIDREGTPGKMFLHFHTDEIESEYRESDWAQWEPRLILSLLCPNGTWTRIVEAESKETEDIGTTICKIWLTYLICLSSIGHYNSLLRCKTECRWHFRSLRCLASVMKSRKERRAEVWGNA